jgi:hypothetical protein
VIVAIQGGACLANAFRASFLPVAEVGVRAGIGIVVDEAAALGWIALIVRAGIPVIACQRRARLTSAGGAAFRAIAQIRVRAGIGIIIGECAPRGWDASVIGARIGVVAGQRVAGYAGSALTCLGPVAQVGVRTDV